MAWEQRWPRCLLTSLGMRYRSCKNGAVSELILGFRDGVYGRIIREDPATGQDCTYIDVTNVYDSDRSQLAEDWTEVVLFGNSSAQDTVSDPYAGDPAVSRQWLADYLYHRYFRLPNHLQVRFAAGTHKLGEGNRTFRTLSARAFPMGKYESVRLDGGLTIHYFYDPPIPGSSHNKSVSGAITLDVSLCSIVYKNEMYDVKMKRQWLFDAPIFGVTFGARNISLHIELDADYPVRPEAYRQFLRRRNRGQDQLFTLDFAEVVRDNRPGWLIELIRSFTPADSDSTNKIRDELQKLLNALRLRTASPKVTKSGDLRFDEGVGAGAANVGSEKDNQSSSQISKMTKPIDLTAVPRGAKSAQVASNPERAPDLQYLLTVEQAEEKGIKGKAARFVAETGQLFVNMTYPAIVEMRAQLEREYADAADLDAMRRMAKAAADYTMVMRVGRAVVFAMAKKLNQEWSFDDMARAQSPEALSLAADDFYDSLQNVRRRMGQALRTSKIISKELEPA